MVFVITFFTFLFITLGIVGLYFLLFRAPSAATERLHEMNQQGGFGVATLSSPSGVMEPMTTLAERFAGPLEKLVPPSAAEARKLQKQLMQAGYRSAKAPAIYRALQLLTLFGLPGMVAVGCLVMARPIDSALTWILLAFVIGFFLPRRVLARLIARRQQLIRWGLADALDLLVVSIEAGLGLNAAMLRVSEELKDVHPGICQEFEIANLEIRVGREREEALRNLAERTGVDDLRSLVAMLIQADKFGTSIARAVRVYSDSLRTRRRQRAEQAAQKASVKLLLPLACFLFPTLFIAILGPAALNLIDTFSKM